MRKTHSAFKKLKTDILFEYMCSYKYKNFIFEVFAD